MRLKVAILALVLAIGMGATVAAIVFPTAVAAGPQKPPDCNGC
jgi:hypothetical protein